MKDLSFRVDLEVEGDFRDLVNGLNQLLDAVIGPYSRMCKCNTGTVQGNLSV